MNQKGQSQKANNCECFIYSLMLICSSRQHIEWTNGSKLEIISDTNYQPRYVNGEDFGSTSVRLKHIPETEN